MTSVSWLHRAVPQVDGLHPYVPGKPVEQLLREKGLSEAVKLASNENPYGPPPKAIEAIRKGAVDAHRYPDGDSNALKQALAGRHGITADRIMLGNGSNEVLELIIRTFAGAGDEVVYSRRGFIVYALAAQAARAKGVAVPESDGLAHDLDAMAAAVNERTKLVCIANPNNPTGSLHDKATVQAFLDRLPRDVIVIVDEAYYEFVADRLGDSVKKLSHPGLVISRTFSKAYGLAGLRVGYGIADAEVTALVNRVREPFNVNMLAQQAALAALDDEAWVMDKVTRIAQERGRLESALLEADALGGKSFGNFVLLRHARADLILQKLEEQGIIPRPLGPYGMPEYLRITVGTAEENARLLSALKPVLDGLQE
jgi:histidinol-phosphate aminotransferase